MVAKFGVTAQHDYFVFSTSQGRTKRSNVYVVKRGYSSLATSYNNGDLRCVRNPTMSEGVASTDGRIYQLFESGADCYRYNEPERFSSRWHARPGNHRYTAARRFRGATTGRRPISRA